MLVDLPLLISHPSSRMRRGKLLFIFIDLTCQILFDRYYLDHFPKIRFGYIWIGRSTNKRKSQIFSYFPFNIRCNIALS